jgi:hypothetical protein
VLLDAVRLMAVGPVHHDVLRMALAQSMGRVRGAFRVVRRRAPRRARGFFSIFARDVSRIAEKRATGWRGGDPPQFGATERRAISIKTLSRSVSPMSNAAAMDTVIAAGIAEQACDVLHRHQQLGSPETLPTCRSVCVQQYGYAQEAL